MNTTSRREEAVWKKIPGKLVNPLYIISDRYSINQFGQVRNDETGHMIKPTHGRRYVLRCNMGVYPTRTTFLKENLMYAAFNNVNVYCGHIRRKNPNMPLHINNLYFLRNYFIDVIC